MSRRYFTITGEDESIVTAIRNEDAKYKSARLFKSKYHLDCDLAMLVESTTATMIPEPKFTTESILAMVAKMMKVPV